MGRPPIGLTSWTPARDKIVREMTAKEAAKRLGVSLDTIYRRRIKLRKKGNP